MEVKEFKTKGIIYEKRVFEMDIKIVLDGKLKTLLEVLIVWNLIFCHSDCQKSFFIRSYIIKLFL